MFFLPLHTPIKLVSLLWNFRKEKPKAPFHRACCLRPGLAQREPRTCFSRQGGFQSVHLNVFFKSQIRHGWEWLTVPEPPSLRGTTTTTAGESPSAEATRTACPAGGSHPWLVPRTTSWLQTDLVPLPGKNGKSVFFKQSGSLTERLQGSFPKWPSASHPLQWAKFRGSPTGPP